MSASLADKARRWSMRVAIGAAVAFVGWMLLLNVALWTGLVSSIVSAERPRATVKLSHGWAWVVWPTRVHVNDLELTIDAPRYQLQLDAPSGTIEISLLELLERRFRAPRIDAVGGQMVLRLKGPEGKVPKRRLALYGEIPGMGPAVQDAKPAPIPPLSDAFEIALDDVRGQLDDLWINEVHFVGSDLDLTGAMYVIAGHALRVDAVGLEGEIEALQLGEVTWLRDAHLAVGVDVSTYDPEEVEGSEVFKHINVDAEFDGEMVSLQALNPFIPPSASVRLSEGAGSIRLDAAMTKGVLVPGSTFELDSKGLDVSWAHKSAGKWSGSADATVRARVDERAKGGVAPRAGVDFNDVVVRRGGADAVVARAKLLEAFAVASSGDLADRDWSLDDGAVHLPKLQLPDLGTLKGLSSKVEPRSGSASLSLHTTVHEQERLGHTVSGSLDNAVFAVGRTSVRSSASFEVGARSARDLSSGKAAKLDVDINGLALRTPRGHSTGTWLKVHGGVVEWDKAGQRAELRGQLEDLRPVLIHATKGKEWIERVPNLNVSAPLDFSVHLQRKGDVSEIVVEKLDRPALSVQAIHRKRGEQSRTAWHIISAAIGGTREAPDARAVHVAVGRDWYARQKRWVEDI